MPQEIVEKALLRSELSYAYSHFSAVPKAFKPSVCYRFSPLMYSTYSLPHSSATASFLEQKHTLTKSRFPSCFFIQTEITTTKLRLKGYAEC